VVQVHISHDFEVKHDGKLYPISIHNAPAERCSSCGNVTFGSDVDTSIDAALRDHLGLLTPEQIRANRKLLNLTQAQLAELICCAGETLSRWETGAIVQSRGADRLLRAFFGLPELRAFFTSMEHDRSLGAEVVFSSPTSLEVPRLNTKCGFMASRLHRKLLPTNTAGLGSSSMLSETSDPIEHHSEHKYANAA
jgi:putative zinc finger/helix-turn-helix YgiT family protein